MIKYVYIINKPYWSLDSCFKTNLLFITFRHTLGGLTEVIVAGGLEEIRYIH